MAENTENTDSAENTENAEEPRNIACPYCGEQLHVTMEFYGGYLGRDEVAGFECSDYKCGADWDKEGKLISKPNYLLYPDRYTKPVIAKEG
ncbi:MAG: hypothetical protein H9W81_15765 [Enterococcus sp.]|nr:hypothetical protein [Enterococcus sp.]